MKSSDLWDWIKMKALGLKGYFLYYFRFCTYKLPKYIFLKIRGRRFIHFIHIPKTGGTAIKNALRGALNESSLIIVLHPHLINLSHIPSSDMVFFFVRDPITRFVSAYNMKKEILATGNRKFLPRNEIMILETFASANELAEALTTPIKHRRELAKQAFESMFFVMENLSDWLISKEYLLRRIDSILFIGRQENLEEDFLQLKSLLDLSEGTSLTSDLVEANRSMGKFDTSLSKFARRNLEDIYKEDYEILLTCDKIREQIRSRNK